MRMSKRRVKVKDLKKNKLNYTLHSAEQVDKLVKSIERFGYLNPIVVNEKLEILAGHGRFDAILKRGDKEVEVLVVEGLDRDAELYYMLADNLIADESGFDLKVLYEELEKLSEDLVGFTGYDESEIEHIKKEMENALPIKPPEERKKDEGEDEPGVKPARYKVLCKQEIVDDVVKELRQRGVVVYAD